MLTVRRDVGIQEMMWGGWDEEEVGLRGEAAREGEREQAREVLWDSYSHLLARRWGGEEGKGGSMVRELDVMV